MSEQNQNTNTTITEPSTFSAIKDQLLGATKEVIGAVFNRNLQNAGAEQRVHGEIEFEAIQNHSSVTSESSWSGSSDPEKILMETSDPFGSTEPSVKTLLPKVEHSEPSRGWLGSFVPINTSTQPLESSKGWLGSTDPEKVLMETSDPFGSFDPSVRPPVVPPTSGPSEPSRGWLGSLASIIPSTHHAEPSKTHPSDPTTMSAIQNQLVGTTKEVVGAFFNENLQNSGAEQRIQGERDYQNLHPVSPQEPSIIPPVVPPTSGPSEPSKIVALKDQLVGSTKEAIGSVLSQNLYNAGIEQRIHGERESLIAEMPKESQAKYWDQSVGAIKENDERAFEEKKLQTQGLVQQAQGEVNRMVNA